MGYWAEIRNDYFDETIAPNEGDLLAAISIDAWHEMDDAEEGKVIAQVLLSKHGDVLVDYRDSVARIDEAAQAAIREASEQLKEHFAEKQKEAPKDLAINVVDDIIPHRNRMLLFSTLEILRKEIRPKFSDWKDADDWLFAQLDFTKDELAQIYEGRDTLYYDGSAVENSIVEKDGLFGITEITVEQANQIYDYMQEAAGGTTRLLSESGLPFINDTGKYYLKDGDKFVGIDCSSDYECFVDEFERLEDCVFWLNYEVEAEEVYARSAKTAQDGSLAAKIRGARDEKASYLPFQEVGGSKGTPER